MITILALYPNWEAADELVENLLDDGFQHRDILLMSGHHWFDQPHAVQRSINGLQGGEVLVQVRKLSKLQALNIKEQMMKAAPLALKEYTEVMTGQKLAPHTEMYAAPVISIEKINLSGG